MTVSQKSTHLGGANQNAELTGKRSGSGGLTNADLQVRTSLEMYEKFCFAAVSKIRLCLQEFCSAKE